MDENVKAFVIYITSLRIGLILIYLAKKAQIAFLIAEKLKILAKYLIFLDIFLEKKTLVLLELIKLNQHSIKL